MREYRAESCFLLQEIDDGSISLREGILVFFFCFCFE